MIIKSYEIEMNHYQKMNPDLHFETVYLKSSYFKPLTAKNFEERVGDVVGRLSSDDEISLLVLATHGSTDQKANRTVLSKLGSFGADGSGGILKRFFELVGPNFASDLKILLESCSTYCGTKDAILQRTRGLYDELSSYGVKNLSVWGATQMMMTSQLDRTSLPAFLKSVNTKLVKVVLPLGIAGTFASRDIYPMVMSGVFIASMNALAGAQYASSGTAGWEVAMTGEAAAAVPRDYYQTNLFNQDIRCEDIFSR